MADSDLQKKPPLYNRLAALRADRNMTRKDLAAAVGVHYQTIGYLERGEYRPSLVLALQIARLFEVPVDAVFSLDPLDPMSQQLYAEQEKSRR